MTPFQTRLIETAAQLGTSDAQIIPAGDIPLDPSFAEYCRPCPHFGTSLGCPPHAMDPEGFRQFAAGFSHALVFKFDIPWEILLSEQRTAANRVLHETAAALERAALAMGFFRARGFAAGGCKATFCPEEARCAGLEKNGNCRHPDAARASLSGMGVNFKALSQGLGWHMDTKIPTEPKPGSTGMMAGIVLIRQDPA